MPKKGIAETGKPRRKTHANRLSNNRNKTNRRPPLRPPRLNKNESYPVKIINSDSILVGDDTFTVEQLIDMTPEEFSKLLKDIPDERRRGILEDFFAERAFIALERRKPVVEVNTEPTRKVRVKNDNHVYIGKMKYTKKEVVAKLEEILETLTLPEDQIALIEFSGV